MLVDDDIDILELLQRHLKSMNYHTYKAVSVKEALYILKDTEIDLLVTDINMPEIDGLELVKYVTEHYPDMPKLVVTGFPSAEDASKVIKHGATDYLTKPFTKVELETAVKRAFASKTNGQTFKRPPKPTQAANGFDGMIGGFTKLPKSNPNYRKGKGQQGHRIGEWREWNRKGTGGKGHTLFGQVCTGAFYSGELWGHPRGPVGSRTFRLYQRRFYGCQ